MTRTFAFKVIYSLLAITLLMLVLGSAWHVHDHHTSKADFCLWCQAAATVAVLVVAIILAGTLLAGRRSTQLALLPPADQRPWSPRASRAPPIL